MRQLTRTGVGLALLTIGCWAQSQQGRSWVTVINLKVKPGMAQEYEALIKSDLIPAYKKAGVAWRRVWQPVFGDLNDYIVVTPIPNFAALDGPSPLVSSLGEKRAAELRAKLDRLYTARERNAFILREELSISHPMEGPPQYAVAITNHIAPGKLPEFENWMITELLPALRKAEVQNYVTAQRVFGGESAIVSLYYIKNLAVIDQGPPTWKSLGREGTAQMNSKAAGLVHSSELRIVRHRSDLGYSAPRKE